MYQSRQSISVLRLVILGVVAGIAFLIFDNMRNNSASPAPTPTLAATIAPAGQPTAVSTSVAQPGSEESYVNRPQPGTTNLFIPSAGIFTPVVEVFLDGTSWDVSQLGNNVGHLEGTAWVDTGGNVALSGHVELSDGRQGIFANIDELEVGDLIEIQQGEEVWRYSVAEVTTTTPEDLTPIYPSDVEKLTLITCGNYDFFQDSYLERIVVTAVRIG